MDRSVKSLLSITLIVAAVFVAMNRVVENARLEDWWLFAVLIGLAILIYVWEGIGRGSSAATGVEAGHSSLDGFRQIAPPPQPAVVIAPRVLTEEEADHEEILKAYSEIRDTDVRSDVMASSATTDTQEARSIQGMVQNVTDVGANGTFEEVDEIAGGPTASMSNDRTKAAPVMAAKADPLPEVPQTAETSSRSTYNDTEARSDIMASTATMDTPEAQEAETGIVENVMETGATGTPEEVDEIAGGPAPSISADDVKDAPVNAAPPPAAATPAPASTPTPAPTTPAAAPVLAVSESKSDSVPEVSSSEGTGSQGEYIDTQSRSDLMASTATMDTPEAQEAETGIVENIMETGATGTPEEVDEISGGPAPSISAEEAKSAPASANPDNLTVIEGIGAKMDAALKAAGIDTFARLSTTSEADIRAAIGAAGMRFAPSVPTWPHQASLAAAGNWDELKAYQQTLKAGRKK